MGAQSANRMKAGKEKMISFLEMVQHFPMGAAVELPGSRTGESEKQEVIGYEYYNGTGYLHFRDMEKINAEQCMRKSRVM